MKYVVQAGGDAPPWGQRLAGDITRQLDRVGGDIKVHRFAKADLPADDSIRIAIVTDEAGGEVLAFFTSANEWRRATDRAVVS